MSASHCSECAAPLAPSKRGLARVVCSAACRKARGFRLARGQWEAAKAAAPDGIARRTCSACGTEKEVRRPKWPFSNGAPIGSLCFLCFRSRKKNEYDPRHRAEHKELGPSLKRRVRAAVKIAKEAARIATAPQGLALEPDAVRLGVEAVNAVAESTMAEVIEHANDPASPFHKEAIQLLADRILPMNVINEVAANMVRRGEFGDTAGDAGKAPSGPRFVVTISPTAGPTRGDE